MGKINFNKVGYFSGWMSFVIMGCSFLSHEELCSRSFSVSYIVALVLWVSFSLFGPVVSNNGTFINDHLICTILFAGISFIIIPEIKYYFAIQDHTDFLLLLFLLVVHVIAAGFTLTKALTDL